MATFCFAEPDGKRALFGDAAAQGMLAAVRDFPRFKSDADCQVAAIQEAETLRQEVCCTGGDNDAAYQQLVASAYVSLYKDIERSTERDLTVWAADVKRATPREALRSAREVLAQGKGKEELDALYEQFIELSGRF